MNPRICCILLLLAAVVSAQVSDDSCPPDTCGKNAICKMLNGAPNCECPEGRYGSPWKQCVAECEEDGDCASGWFCEKFRCRPACSSKTCAYSADCTVVNHQPVCECLPGFKGDPRKQCLPECDDDYDCPNNMVCYYPKCVDPCKFSCGKNALCKVENKVPICSCPKGMTGNPFTSCRVMTPDDVCSPNPCGKNANCSPKRIIEGGYSGAICSCPPGYYGSPLKECQKGDCEKHSDCLDDLLCIRSQCTNPCKEGMCPHNKRCVIKSHQIYCLNYPVN